MSAETRVYVERTMNDEVRVYTLTANWSQYSQYGARSGSFTSQGHVTIIDSATAFFGLPNDIEEPPRAPTPKELRDRAAAAAHRDLMARSVRSASPPKPKGYGRAKAFADAPRIPCYRGSRPR